MTDNCFSKYFSMTGWRVGWLVLPEALVRPVECLAQNMAISAPHMAQVAAEAAFECGDELEANVAGYRRSRELLLRVLPEAGFPRLAAADGAFHLYADVSERTNDSVASCARMLAEAGVAASPGTDFDAGRGLTTMRPATAVRKRTWRRQRRGCGGGRECSERDFHAALPRG